MTLVSHKIRAYSMGRMYIHYRSVIGQRLYKRIRHAANAGTNYVIILKSQKSTIGKVILRKIK